MDKLEEKVYRFGITGRDESEIHGKTIRKEIKSIADPLGRRGSVRNTKFQPEIVVHVVASSKEDAGEFKQAIEKRFKTDPRTMKLTLKCGEIHQLTHEQAEDFSNFKAL